MKRCPWFGAAVLMMVGAAAVLTVWVSPLSAQDGADKVQPPTRHAVGPLVDAAAPRAAAIADTHRVALGRLELPDDAHVTSPITFGIANSGASQTGAGRRRAPDPVYENITLGGALTGEHDMIAFFKEHLGHVHELTINILSTRGAEISTITGDAMMVEVSLDLEARTWELVLALSSGE